MHYVPDVYIFPYWCTQTQYSALAESLEQMSHDLMDCVRTGDEQQAVLGTGTTGVRQDVLARLKLGVHYRHKKVCLTVDFTLI